MFERVFVAVDMVVQAAVLVVGMVAADIELKQRKTKPTMKEFGEALT
jgi:hypothetical protein